MSIGRFRVAVGVSGGVDSAVAALLLKRLGYDVLGVFMRNWDLQDEKGQCSVETDLSDAEFVCSHLSIPLHVADFVKPYWTDVFEDLVKDYQGGLTPNPDILCNRRIKFDRFLDFVTDRLGCDLMATGHYARRSSSPVGVRLLQAFDPDKDQTFFLSQIPQRALQKTLFPLGNFLKRDIKTIAVENGLQRIANRKESMGICFIGNRHFPHFIGEYVNSAAGRLVNIDDGRIVGVHEGQHQFTVGQRCRLGGHSHRTYIARKTAQSEELLTVPDHDHPLLLSSFTFTSPPHWIHSAPRQLTHSCLLHCQFRFQHRQSLVNCLLYRREGTGSLLLFLNQPLRALTPGQYAVFYLGDECLGSARILYVGPSEYALNYGRLPPRTTNLKPL